MKVYPKSSWFLPLLGFALIAVGSQESAECPTPDKVSCTTGTKCDSDGDCLNQELCCANPCYTKRCVPNPGGGDDVDGPSESECRPYIERALKELETGEARKESSDKNESAEDVPTVEISDDFGYQVLNEADRDDNEVPNKESLEEIEELETQQEIERKDEEPEILLDKSSEEIVKGSTENASPEIQFESQPSGSVEEEASESAETTNVIEEAEVAQTREEATESNERTDQVTEELEEETIAQQSTSDEDDTREQLIIAEVNEEIDVKSKETVESVETIEDETVSQHVKESKESVEEEEQHYGCPAIDSVSCKEGKLCNKHKECDENQICCPNKCYRKRCVAGAVTESELQAEESEEKSKETESIREKVVAVSSKEVLGTGCPPAVQVSCVNGDLCSKHKHCGDGEICCPNKCYRKRCVAGTVSSAEESEEEDSEEEQPKKEDKVEDADQVNKEGLGCPSMDQISCKEGDLCSKHKHCRRGEICCPNKCYRKRCVAGAVSSGELEEEDSAEESEEKSSEQERVQDKKKEQVVGCPSRDDVPCKGGESCLQNRDCDSREICCANKCYRKVCVPGTRSDDDDDDDVDVDVVDVDVKEQKGAVEEPKITETSQDADSRCPPKEQVSCREGQRCDGDDDCETKEVCCPNKCYNKRCVLKTEEESEEREIREEKLPVKPVTKYKVEIKKEVKIKVLPSEPKKETKKLEVRRPGKPSKVVVIEEMEEDEEASFEKGGEAPVEELSFDSDVPTELRPRDHVEHLLKLDKDSSDVEKIQNKVYEETLKELKRLYESAIKPLETLYKYRDLSNRHFGDAEIFSKPLVLFMGPWSGGKSSIINYLVNNEYNETSLRTGAEPSPAYFNILMYGEEPEIIDGTELAADFTFSGLQKFGQGLEERLRGVRLPAKLLQKVNIVEIPGILEVRKQVSRLFPFNDACQWFIDRADIIFLVYDPSKLDVGPETEAILDQLKGREHQTRIILNKADQVKPEELMRVQSALIWNISPLMSSPQPPVMYTTSLWSRPFEPWAPVRLLQAQERAFLRDLRGAVDKRVENKIASARRFAVRVRNHAKMVDCYLTTYYNHKSVFGNRKQVANEIIEHPQDYHIYEGLSTLTNISRYDLPDPEVYKDFFKLNPLYEFQQLSATCTYFRGCPINRLDIAIAYDLPELVGTYKRNLEEAFAAPAPPSPQPDRRDKKAAPGS